MEWFNNIESSNEQTNEVIQVQELDLWHQEILKNYEYKIMFIDFIKSLNPEDKERFLNILKHIPDEELQEYLEDSFEDDSEENWEYFFDEFAENYYIPKNSQTNKNPKETLKSIPKINPKIKEIINTINILTDTDKSNQLIIDSLIKQINDFKSLNIRPKELKLLESNFRTLNKYKENIIEAEKNKVEAKKDKVEAEKDKVEAEKDKVELKEKEINIKETKKEAEAESKWKKILRSKIETFKDIDKEFYNILLEDANLSDSTEKDAILIQKMVDYLSKPWNATDFLTKLKQNTSNAEYNKIYNALCSISPEIKKILNNAIYFDDSEPIIQEWNKIISWDKYIDFSTNPPLWYITLKNWLKLQTKITAPHTMKLRAEFAKKQKEYEKTVWKLKENIEKLDTEIIGLKNDISEKKSRIEQIQNSDISPEDKKRFIKNIKEIILKNQKLIETKIKLINENKSAFEIENGKFKKVKEAFETNMYELIEASRDELLEWDEKARKSLHFLDSLGIDPSLQPALQDMIKVINRNSGLRNKLGFDRRIDLSNFDLWIDNWLGNNKQWENSIKTKEKFASIVNILLSGSRKRPIVTESMSTWTTFTNESWEILSKDRAIWDIKENMWMNTYGHMMVNAMEYSGEDE